MHILHTESSRGWGGQEMRILKEAEGMRARGHEIILAVNTGGKLISRARHAGFTVYELAFTKFCALKTISQLLQIAKKHQIDLFNTHSSLDAWLGGIAARIAGKKVIRTRHLSTPIAKGLNSHLLYKKLADFVVTTSSVILPTIAAQARLPASQLRCIPTGIDSEELKVDESAVATWRASLGVKPQDILIGTACFVRSWKGIDDLLQAAKLLSDHSCIKWVIVGGGHVDDYRSKITQMGLDKIVTCTGHLESPYLAIKAMDIFALLSTAHEGISQSSLQAAYLERPLITTSVGGLPEVCLDGKTGWVVPPFSPKAIVQAVNQLINNPKQRLEFGLQGKKLIEVKFLLQKTLDEMEGVYRTVMR